MLVEQIPVHNELRNYMYLIACPETLAAVAIDPLDHERCLQRASSLGWTINSVINTHEHYDHTGGNAPVIAATGATLYAHEAAIDKIEHVDVGLKAGDVVSIGNSVKLIAMDTPGHTYCHTCLYYAGDETHAPALFCGDTLFNAGVGNCHGGSAEVLYKTFAEQLFVLPNTTRIFPGHDYIVNNLNFTLNREPDNAAATSLLEALNQWPEGNHFISTIATEKAVNTFFRLTSPTVVKLIKERFPELSDDPSEEDVFLKLRSLRDHW